MVAHALCYEDTHAVSCSHKQSDSNYVVPLAWMRLLPLASCLLPLASCLSSRYSCARDGSIGWRRYVLVLCVQGAKAVRVSGEAWVGVARALRAGPLLLSLNLDKLPGCASVSVAHLRLVLFVLSILLLETIAAEWKRSCGMTCTLSLGNSQFPPFQNMGSRYAWLVLLRVDSTQSEAPFPQSPPAWAHCFLSTALTTLCAYSWTQVEGHDFSFAFHTCASQYTTIHHEIEAPRLLSIDKARKTPQPTASKQAYKKCRQARRALEQLSEICI
jgi:hypothetical protein